MSNSISNSLNPLVFTDNAAAKVWQLIEDEGNFNLKLRVYVTGGGCSGLQYGFTFDEEIQPDAQIAGKERGRRRIVARIGQHAINVGGLQAGILHGTAHRHGAHRPRAAPRATRIRRLADANDRVLVAQVFRCGGISVCR